MKYITLTVTDAVIRQVNRAGMGRGDRNQRQIAIQGASPDLLALIRSAREDRRVVIPVSGEFSLTIGDNGAIWAGHQSEGLQAEDFTSLYNLLARRPDQPVRFSWE
jgi:hypothetical protein